MARFTVDGADEAEDLVRGELQILVEETVRAIGSNLVAIVLTGSFGRGEGAVRREVGGVRAVNDYDVTLVVRSKRGLSRTLARLKAELERRLSVRWVDLSLTTPKALTRLAPTMYNFDLVHGGRVLWGDVEVLTRAPSLRSADIPWREGEILFFTRLWCFLGGIDLEALPRGLTDEQDIFFRTQMAKAIIAAGDVGLLSQGAYHWSLEDRLPRYETLLSWKPEELELIRWGVRQKLRPAPGDGGEPMKLWGEVRRVYLMRMREFLESSYDNGFDGWSSYLTAYRRRPRQLLKRMAYIVAKRSLRYERKLSVQAAELLLLSAFDGESLTLRPFEAALDHLQEVAPEVSGLGRDLIGWNAARAVAAHHRMVV